MASRSNALVFRLQRALDPIPPGEPLDAEDGSEEPFDGAVRFEGSVRAFDSFVSQGSAWYFSRSANPSAWGLPIISPTLAGLTSIASAIDPVAAGSSAAYWSR